MTARLPQPLTDYFAAKNRHDIDTMLVLLVGRHGQGRR